MAVSFPSAALVRKDLITDLRRRRSYVCLAVLVAACILVAVRNCPDDFSNPVATARSSRQLVQTIMFTLSLGCVLFVPGLAGAAIAVEKEERTFDLLHLTLIPPGGIVLAKLLNTLGLFLLLAIATMPILGVVFFLVGVDWVELARMVMVLTATTFSCAMVGMLCSARFASTSAAIIGSYVVTLLLMGAPLLLIELSGTFFRLGGVLDAIDPFERVLSPPFTIMSMRTRPVDWYLSAVYQATLALICFVLTVRILRRPPKPLKVDTRKPIDDTATLEKRRRTFPFYLIDPLRRKKPIGDLQNPMLVKELQWGTMGRSPVLIRVFYASFIVFLLITAIVLFRTIYSTRYSDSYDGAVFLTLIAQMYLVIAIAPALMANALTKEYGIGNMDMLRMTLLSPKEIVLGKLSAGAVCLSPLLLAAFLAGLPLAFVALFFPGVFSLLFTGYITLLVCALVSLSLGLLSSLLTRRTGTSVVLSYFLSIVVFGALTLICLFLESWLLPRTLYRGPAGHGFDMVVHFLSPIAAFWANYNYYRDWTRNTSLVNLYWLANVTVFGLFGRAMIMFCVAQFKRVGMRDR